MSHKLLIAVSAFAAVLIGFAWVSLPAQTIPPAEQQVTSQPSIIQSAATQPVSRAGDDSEEFGDDDDGSAAAVAPAVTPTPTPTPKPTPTPVSSGITMAQVAQHGNMSSCWSAINGKVYNLTSWINQHPGGPDMILSICGTNGSAAFNAQHSGQPRPANELTNFYIGNLAQ